MAERSGSMGSQTSRWALRTAELIYLDDSLWNNFWKVGVKAYAKIDFAVSSPIFDVFPWMRPAVF